MRIVNNLVNVTRGRDGEHWFLYHGLATLVTQEFSTKYNLDMFYKPFQEAFAAESASYSAVTKLASTEQIANADAARDKCMRRVSLGIEYGMYSDEADVTDAAKHCKEILSAHRGASSKSYAENTAAVTDIVEQFQSEKYADDIAALGLTEVVAALKTANEAFKKVYMERIPERYARSNRESMRSVRTRVDATFADLADAINAIYIMAAYLEPNADNAAEIKAMADAVNGAIYQFQLTLARRGVGNSTGSTDTPADPTDPTEPTEPTDPDEGDSGETDSPDNI